MSVEHCPVFNSLISIRKALACPQGLGLYLAVASLGVLPTNSAPDCSELTALLTKGRGRHTSGKRGHSSCLQDPSALLSAGSHAPLGC